MVQPPATFALQRPRSTSSHPDRPLEESHLLWRGRPGEVQAKVTPSGSPGGDQRDCRLNPSKEIRCGYVHINAVDDPAAEVAADGFSCADRQATQRGHIQESGEALRR